MTGNFQIDQTVKKDKYNYSNVTHKSSNCAPLRTNLGGHPEGQKKVPMLTYRFYKESIVKDIPTQISN